MVLQRKRCAREARRGVAAVELAVLLPFLVLIMVFAIDFGLVFFGTLAAGNAATNGAYYVVYQNNGDIYPYTSETDAATQDATSNSNLPTSTITTSSTGSTSDANGYDINTVTVTYTFTAITKIINPTISTVSRSIVARVPPSTPK